MFVYHFLYNDYKGLVFRYSESYTNDLGQTNSIFQNPVGNWIIVVVADTYEDALKTAEEYLTHLEDYK